MSDGEIIEKIASIDEQIHDLRKMVLKGGSHITEDETREAAREWLAEAKKLEKKNGQKQPLLSLKLEAGKTQEATSGG